MRDTLTEAGLRAQRKIAILNAREVDFIHVSPCTPCEAIKSEALLLAIVRDAEAAHPSPGTLASLQPSWTSLEMRLRVFLIQRAVRTRKLKHDYAHTDSLKQMAFHCRKILFQKDLRQRLAEWGYFRHELAA
jgi:hypothetical protein